MNFHAVKGSKILAYNKGIQSNSLPIFYGELDCRHTLSNNSVLSLFPIVHTQDELSKLLTPHMSLLG